MNDELDDDGALTLAAIFSGRAVVKRRKKDGKIILMLPTENADWQEMPSAAAAYHTAAEFWRKQNKVPSLANIELVGVTLREVNEQ